MRHEIISSKTLLFPSISVYTGKEIGKVYVTQLQLNMALIIICQLGASAILFINTNTHCF